MGRFMVPPYGKAGRKKRRRPGQGPKRPFQRMCQKVPASGGVQPSAAEGRPGSERGQAAVYRQNKLSKFSRR